MGKRPTVIGELERKVEAAYGKSIYFKTRLAGRGERLDTITYQRDLEEKIHMVLLTKTDIFSYKTGL